MEEVIVEGVEKVVNGEEDTKSNAGGVPIQILDARYNPKFQGLIEKQPLMRRFTITICKILVFK